MEQVRRLLQGEKATLTITSPPYNMGHNASLATNKELGNSKYAQHSDARQPADYLALLEAVTHNALVVSEVVILNIQMLSGNKVVLLEFLYQFRHHLIDIAVWDKGCAAPAMARNVMNSRYEFLLFLTAHRSKGKTPRTIPTANFRGTIQNVYQGPPQRSNSYFRLHAATFPLHLPKWLMENFDATRGKIFDPFLGTGSTLMAAEQVGWHCVGIEIEPRYCDLVLHRYESDTGKVAEKVDSGYVGS